MAHVCNKPLETETLRTRNHVVSSWELSNHDAVHEEKKIINDGDNAITVVLHSLYSQGPRVRKTWRVRLLEIYQKLCVEMRRSQWLA